MATHCLHALVGFVQLPSSTRTQDHHVTVYDPSRSSLWIPQDPYAQSLTSWNSAVCWLAHMTSRLACLKSILRQCWRTFVRYILLICYHAYSYFYQGSSLWKHFKVIMQSNQCLFAVVICWTFFRNKWTNYSGNVFERLFYTWECFLFTRTSKTCEWHRA